MAIFYGVSFLRAKLGLNLQHKITDAFVCRRCLQHQARVIKLRGSVRQTPFLKAFRQRDLPTHARSQSSAIQSQPSQSSIGALGQNIGIRANTTPSRPSSWPKTSSTSVAYWLLGSAASVFGIVIFGGLTRLTESGLSITEWRPVTGSLPPVNQQIWEEEFARYKLSPEFKMLNSRMNLDEFKQIYWMEWGHRLWGRVVGITFLLPTAYFIIRRRVSSHMALRLVGICGLIGFQGVIGWWMVKSGLKDDLFETGKHPRVSQYRLAAHLGTAFIAYLSMLHNGLQILRENSIVQNPRKASEQLDLLKMPSSRTFARLVGGLAVLVFVTAMSGALVAGLDAGLIYNDFPWMGQGLVPPSKELFDPFYSHTSDQKDLYWRNALENPVLVQLDHRILATTTFTAVMALWAYSRMHRSTYQSLPRNARIGMLGVVHLVGVQVALGITTLWYLVPTALGAAHQAGALALLTGVFVLGSRVWLPRRTLRLMQDAQKRILLESQTTVSKSTSRPLHVHSKLLGRQ